MLGIGVFMGISVTYSSSTNPLLMLGSGAMMLASVGASVANHLQQRKRYKVDTAERIDAFNQALSTIRKTLEEARSSQLEAMQRVNPPPEECLQRILTLHSCLWERRPQDDDFLFLRIGTGEVPTSLQLRPHKPPAVLTPGKEKDLHKVAVDLGDEFKRVPGAPIGVALEDIRVLGVSGSPPAQHALLRSIVAGIATHNSPDEVKIAFFMTPTQREDWAWVRWLPHVHGQIGGLSRWIASNEVERKRICNALGQEWGRRKLQVDFSGNRKEPPLPRFVLILIDREALQEPAISRVLSEGEVLGAYAIVLGPKHSQLPKQCGAILEMEPGEAGRFTLVGVDQPSQFFKPDSLDHKTGEALARAIAPLRPAREVSANELPDSLRVLELHGARRVEELAIWENWSTNKIYEELEAPIGVRAGGHPIALNLWENVHGPHGLLAGATRSGKSELLKTLVSSLAIQYHPHDLNFVLIDYKGGGLNRDIEELPHVVGSATNLEEGLPERAIEAIKAELIRRESVLRGRHIKNYQRDFHAGKEKEPLPRLIVIIDEFAELAQEEPETLNSLVSAARVGGSLGVHLILATQKPAGVVKGQIWSNSRFRLCLRVESAEDSNDMLRRPDAAAIDRPGRGYFQVGDNEVYELIQVARAEATYVAGEAIVSDAASIARVHLDGRRDQLWPPPDPTASTVVHMYSTTDLQAIVQYINQIADNHNVKRLPGPWLPMLPEKLDIIRLRDIYAQGGWDGREWLPSSHWLRPVVGQLDDTIRQEQPPLLLDLGQRGHLYLCGGASSGKTTFLRTVIGSLTHDHSPAELNLYLLDYGGRGLDVFEALPHVGAVLHPGDEEVVERLFRWLDEEIKRRNALLTGSPNLPTYLEAEGAEPLPAIVLVIDSYAALVELLEDAPDYVQRLARSGHNVGVHLIVAADRVGALSTRAATNFNLRMAYYLPERSDYSLILGKSPSSQLQSIPGRSIWKGESLLECQAAAHGTDLGYPEGAAVLANTIEAMAQAWEGPVAHPMRELPKQVFLESLLETQSASETDVDPDSLRVPVGLDALRIEPVVLDLTQTGPHFLIAGLPQSGKTSAIRTLLTSMSKLYSPKQVEFWVADCFQRGLDTFKDIEHTRAYAMGIEPVRDLIEKLCGVLETRTTGDEGAAHHIVLVMDDYDFFDEPRVKDDLQDWARRARTVKLHLVLAGSADELRSGFDDLRRQVLVCRSGLLLSSAPDDGQVFKIRIPYSSGSLPPGRGYLINRGQPVLVQWAFV
jgi:S-DNA-T family DNA segregation ATPase FtsK/SpoIIIE